MRPHTFHAVNSIMVQSNNRTIQMFLNTTYQNLTPLPSQRRHHNLQIVPFLDIRIEKLSFLRLKNLVTLLKNSIHFWGRTRTRGGGLTLCIPTLSPFHITRWAKVIKKTKLCASVHRGGGRAAGNKLVLVHRIKVLHSMQPASQGNIESFPTITIPYVFDPTPTTLRRNKYDDYVPPSVSVLTQQVLQRSLPIPGDVSWCNLMGTADLFLLLLYL